MPRLIHALFLIVPAVLFPLEGISGAAARDAAAGNGKKILVVYFSLQGNTRKAAEAIHAITGGDIAEIISLEDYRRPDVEDDAKRQIEQGYMPAIQKLAVNPRDYDIIFVGSPVWWFTLTPPVKRFLHDTGFKGKRLVPFCTCISDYGHIFYDFRKNCPGADIAPGLNIFDSGLNDRAALDRKLRTWINEAIGNK